MIADELECEVEDLLDIVNIINSFEPPYDVAKIMQKLEESLKNTEVL